MVKVSKQKLTIVNCACRLKHFPDGFLSKECQSNCNLIRKTNKFRHSMFYLRYVRLGKEIFCVPLVPWILNARSL